MCWVLGYRCCIAVTQTILGRHTHAAQNLEDSGLWVSHSHLCSWCNEGMWHHSHSIIKRERVTHHNRTLLRKHSPAHWSVSSVKPSLCSISALCYFCYGRHKMRDALSLGRVLTLAPAQRCPLRAQHRGVTHIWWWTKIFARWISIISKGYILDIDKYLNLVCRTLLCWYCLHHSARPCQSAHSQHRLCWSREQRTPEPDPGL